MGHGAEKDAPAEKWREAGWQSPDDILDALTACCGRSHGGVYCPDVDVLIEVGHPSRPDREDLMRQHLERIRARARAEALRDAADDLARCADAGWSAGQIVTALNNRARGNLDRHGVHFLTAYVWRASERAHMNVDDLFCFLNGHTSTDGDSARCHRCGNPMPSRAGFVVDDASHRQKADLVRMAVELVIDDIEATFLAHLPSKALSYCAQEDVNAGLDAMRERFGLDED